MSNAVALAMALMASLVLFVVPASAINPTSVARCHFFMTDLGVSNTSFIRGNVTFLLDSTTQQVNVTVNVETSLPDAPFGIHVHTYGDLTNQASSNTTAGHYVGRGNSTHNCPEFADLRHEGDMGNWQVTSGRILQSKVLNLLALSGDFSIIGRAVELHQQFDDCSTQPTGASGGRLAHCVIGIADVDYNQAYAATENATSSRAVCVLKPTTNCPEPCNLTGTVYFDQTVGGNGVLSTTVTAHVEGLESGSVHSIKVNEYGDWISLDGTGSGNHYNPYGRSHKLPTAEPRHVGDLGNIQSYDDATGVAWYRLTENYMPALSNIYGRSVLIGLDRDHGNGAGCSRGSSGPDVLMCVIGIANPTTIFPSVPSGVTINNTFVDVDCVVPCTSSASVPSSWVGWAIDVVEAVIQ